MAQGIERLNELTPDAATAEFLACCGSKDWARRMASARPFGDPERLLEVADRAWWSLSEADWREAFAAHPRIGDRTASGRAGEEQSESRGAPAETLAALARANRDYEERFGYIFIVCATGKTAEQMLVLCRSRLQNDAQRELRVAAEEQRQITRLRLAKLLDTP